MIWQLIQENLSALIQHDVSHIHHQKNFRPNSLSALARANSLETKFLGETFENRNMLGNKSGQSLSVSNSYSRGPTPSQKVNQVKMHCCFESATTERSNYQDTHAMRV